MKKEKLKIALANLKVNLNDDINSLSNKPNLDLNKLDIIHKILNLARRSYVDMVVFPEISIPLYWLNDLITFSKNNNIAIIGGLEHFSINQVAFNYSFVLLPFKDNKKYKNVFIDFNLKKYYSPDEIKEIECKFLKSPKMNNSNVKIYSYYDIKFAVYNCFELTNLELRSQVFKKVDFVIVIEYNKDVNYYSNLVTSLSRDLHAYVIQVNTIEYGENRIISPSKTESLDIVKIKGGEDVNVVTGTINIKELRKFQKKSYICQKEDKRYKPTPAGYQSDN